MVRMSLAMVGILLACSVLSAKTPQQLKTEMDAVLPAGKKVRMAWCNSPVSQGVFTAYVYDSEENVIRELTPTSVFGSRRNITDAYISQDGEYVVLKDNSSDAIQTVRFDGTGKQALFNQGTLICRWKDPTDNKQCFIASGLPSPYAAGTWAIGISDLTKRRQISTEVFPKTTSTWGFGCGISVDGKIMGGFHNDRPGVWPTPSGAFQPACCECTGCNYAMRPTTGNGVYEYGHFPESHYEICVHRADGSKKELLPMNCSVPGGDEPQSLYWTNHVDYVTFLMGEGSATNPILFDLARKRCVAIQEGECSGFGCSHRSPSAILLPKVPSAARIPCAATRVSHALRTPQRLYSIEGRLLSGSQTGASTSAARPFRTSAGNQAAAIVVGW